MEAASEFLAAEPPRSAFGPVWDGSQRVLIFCSMETNATKLFS